MRTVLNLHFGLLQKVLVIIFCLVMSVYALLIPSFRAQAAAPQQVELLAVTVGVEQQLVASKRLAVSLPQEFTDQQAPNWDDQSFAAAYWLEQPIPEPANLNANFLQQENLNKLPVQELRSLTATNSDRVEVVVATALQTASQQNVQLSATPQQLAEHLILVYYSSTAAKKVPINYSDIEIEQVTGATYTRINNSSGVAIFGKVGAQFTATFTIKTWWDRKISFRDQSGISLSFSEKADNSNADRVYKTIELTIPDSTTTVTIVGTQFARKNVAVTINPIDVDSRNHAYNMWIAYNIPWQEKDGSRAWAADVPPAYQLQDHVDWQWNGYTHLPKTYGFGRFDPADSDAKYGIRHHQEQISSSYSFLVDAIPQMCDSNRADGGGCSPSLIQQDWLSEIILNGEHFFIPAPQQCLDPDGNERSDHCLILSFSGWSTNGIKEKYLCQRAWLLLRQQEGGPITSETDRICNLKEYLDNRKPNFLNPNTLYEQTITTGVNAGVKITVQLNNVRAVADAGFSINDISTRNANNNGFVNNRANTNRLRTRYQITISGVKQQENTLEVKYDWSTHNRTRLNTSAGVNGLGNQDDAGASVSIFGKKDDNPQTAWREICSESNPASNCSFNYQENGPNPLDLAFQVKNGFTNPVLSYPDFSAFSERGHLRSYELSKTPLDKIYPGAPETALYAQVPRSIARKFGSSEFFQRSTFFDVPIKIDTQVLAVPLTFYDNQGSKLSGVCRDTSDCFRDGRVDGIQNTNYTVPTHIPILVRANSVEQLVGFSHWQLAGFLHGQQQFVVSEQVLPGETLDFTDLRQADGSPALTDEQGTPLVDEFRFVAVSTSSAAALRYFPAVKKVEVRQPAAARTRVTRSVEAATEPQPTVKVVETFTYTAAPGLHAQFDPGYVAANKQYTYETANYDLAEAKSVLTATLTTPGAEENLSLYYRPPQTPLQLTITVDDSSGFSHQPPGPANFGMKLEALDYVEPVQVLTHGDADGSASAGRYRISLQTRIGDQNQGFANWEPSLVWQLTPAGFSCKATGGEEELVDAEAGAATQVLTLAADSAAEVNCSATVQAAAVSLVTYDARNKTGVVNKDFVYNFVPAAGSQRDAEKNWPAHDQPASNGAYFPPATSYTLTGSSPEDWQILGYQQYQGDAPANPFADLTDDSKWRPLPSDNHANVTQPNAFVTADLSVRSSATANDAASQGVAVQFTTSQNQWLLIRAVVAPSNQVAEIAFTKQYQTPDFGPSTRPQVADWALQLQPAERAAVSTPVTIPHQQTVLVPVGEYQFAEVAKQQAAGYQFEPNFAPVSSTCRGPENKSLNETVGEKVQVTAGKWSCTYVNAGAKFALVFFDGDLNQYVARSDINFTISSAPATSQKTGNWPAKSVAASSSDWLTPNQPYQVHLPAGGMPPGWFVAGLERLNRGENPDELPVVSASWTAVPNMTVNVPPGEYAVYRVVAQRVRAPLPAAGWFGPAPFIAGGALLVVVGLVAQRRRFSGV